MANPTLNSFNIIMWRIRHVLFNNIGKILYHMFLNIGKLNREKFKAQILKFSVVKILLFFKSVERKQQKKTEQIEGSDGYW